MSNDLLGKFQEVCDLETKIYTLKEELEPLVKSAFEMYTVMRGWRSCPDIHEWTTDGKTVNIQYYFGGDYHNYEQLPVNGVLDLNVLAEYVQEEKRSKAEQEEQERQRQEIERTTRRKALLLELQAEFGQAYNEPTIQA